MDAHEMMTLGLGELNRRLAQHDAIICDCGLHPGGTWTCRIANFTRSVLGEGKDPGSAILDALSQWETVG